MCVCLWMGGWMGRCVWECVGVGVCVRAGVDV